MEKIFLPTIHFMNAEGRPFKGCLYFGLMITKTGDPYVIEYNCRFGDPETQVVLPLLDGDLLAVMMAVCNETLQNERVEIKNEAAACVVLASGGYPAKYETGYEIKGLNENGSAAGAVVIHAGTKLQNGKFVTAGGRVLGITATGSTLDQALDKAYGTAGKIEFQFAHYRTDIGKKARE
jgi:phosphoribosylamine--glycine ligase